ncbi:hemolysin family protein [Gorillibacterium sp. sgz5001074]|uniref:hemolysin family protein n=1 Tax=Gorillibacterium sp. sgz5001074 TaxID=3446695 RepID=UPI003F66D1C6
MNIHLEWGSIFWNLILVLFLVLLNGFFVAAEFALVRVRATRLQELAEQGNKQARHALRVTRKLDAYLSATQLGITLASLGLGWVGEPAISKLIIEPLLEAFGMEPGAAVTHTISFALAFAVITFLHIVLGELAPKSLAIMKSEATSIWLSLPLMMFYKLFMPAIWLLNGAANRLLRLFGIRSVAEQEAHTEEEIRILMNQSVESGHIDKDEMVLFDNIFEFSDRVAREIMLPRTDMDVLFADLPFQDNMKLVFETKHTRYPVAVEDKDRIIGFVHITDLLTADPEEVHVLEDFMRPILTVPESMELSRVLKLMQKRHSQIAVVIDEYGGTAGLLTAEDILEEIVGEIHDEFDVDERPMIESIDRGISVDGRVLLEELSDMLSVDLEDEEVDSIGGWLLKKTEGMPAVGQRIHWNGLVFEVTEAERYRILRVQIYREQPE